MPAANDRVPIPASADSLVTLDLWQGDHGGGTVAGLVGSTVAVGGGMVGRSMGVAVEVGVGVSVGEGVVVGVGVRVGVGVAVPVGVGVMGGVGVGFCTKTHVRASAAWPARL